MRVRGRLTLVALLLWSGVLARPRLAVAEDPAPTEPAFVSGLARVRDQLADGKAAAAQAQFDQLLEQHRDREYVYAKRAELEDLAGRLAFGKACPLPKPQDVVRGKLMTYGVAFSTTAPRLKVVYTKGQPHDFESLSDLLIHPATFKGAFTIGISGSVYPRVAEDSPVVAFGVEEHPKTGRLQAYQVICGVPRYRQGDQVMWLPAALGQLDGGEQKILKRLDPPPVTAGEPFKLQVKVNDETFTYSVNGKTLGSAPKARGVFGRVAFKIGSWDRVELEGVVEPSWIQGRIDELVQEKRRAFLDGFDVREHLPAWIYERAASKGLAPPPGSPPSTKSPFDEALPAELEPVARLRVLLMTTQMLTGDHDAARKTLADLKGVPPSVTAWLAARLHVEFSALAEALVDLDRTLELAPSFLPARVLRGQVLIRQGRIDEAETSLRALAREHPDDPDVAQAVALQLLLADRQEASRAVLEEAARRGLQSERLDALARALVKVQRGPEWPRVFEHRSANYHVVSDIDQAICARAAKVLEEALGAYKTHFQALQKTPPRAFSVYLFSGQAGFHAYMAEAELFGSGGHENLAGVYSPLLKQLLIWNLPSRDEMLETVRHEGFHQYLDRLLPDAPIWFNEGLAVYYQNLTNPHGVVQHGNLHRDLIALLRKEGLPPLSRLLDDSRRAFYARGRSGYAHAWLFVHMLRHGTPEQRALLDALLARLATEPPHDAVHAVFTPEVLTGLDRDLAAYLEAVDAKR